jgi:hypothetical protein
MKTTDANGDVAQTVLPSSPRFASFYGALPAGATREFACEIGLENVGLLDGGVVEQ